MYTGDSRLSGKISVKLGPSSFNGICANQEHWALLGFGSNAVVTLSTMYLADAAATAIGNMVKAPEYRFIAKKGSKHRGRSGCCHNNRR